MLQQPDGDIQVAPGEVVRVAVTATKTHYLAIFGHLLQAQWTIVQPPTARQNGDVQEVRSFVAPPGGREAFALTCDFVRDGRGQVNADARYLIEISGVGQVPSKRVLPIPPLPISRTFEFEVVAP
jgi:hypothetical protein